MHPFLRIAIKSNKRIIMTVIGIAFCLAYLTGTIAIAGGLHQSTESVSQTFDQGPVMVYADEDLSQSKIETGWLSELEDDYVGVKLINTDIVSGNRHMNDTCVISVYDPMGKIALNFPNASWGNNALLGSSIEVELSEAGFDTSAGAKLNLRKNNINKIINLTALYPPGLIFPNDWIIVSDSVIHELSPEMAGNYSFVIIYENKEAIEPIADDHNLVCKPTTSVVRFFETGMYQVEDNLWSIVLTTGIIVILLVYSIMSIEIQYHRPTIENLRGLGANKRVIIGIFTLKAVMITMAGGIIGVALGICVANGVVSVSSLFGINTIIIPLVNIRSLAIPLALALVSGFVGGLIPSFRASRILKARSNP